MSVGWKTHHGVSWTLIFGGLRGGVRILVVRKHSAKMYWSKTFEKFQKQIYKIFAKIFREIFQNFSKIQFKRI